MAQQSSMQYRQSKNRQLNLSIITSQENPPNQISIESIDSREQLLLNTPEKLLSLSSPSSNSRSLTQSPSTANDSNYSTIDIATLIKRYQPSKQFLAKCQTEQDNLLESIKGPIHSEIKTIYNENLFTDLSIYIGDDFKKAVNRCILASRAHKFYNALKAFKKDILKDKDIIIIQFQDINSSSSNDLLADDSGLQSFRESTVSENEENLINDPNYSIDYKDYLLPPNVITSDLLLNFIRRIFTDQDISQDESELHKRLIDWLKLNKPELLKKSNTNTTKPIKPELRESFRTIQADFKRLSLAADSRTNTPTSISDTDMSHSQFSNKLAGDSDPIGPISSEPQDETVLEQYKNENLLSSLNRTETFELLTKNKSDSPSINNSSKASELSDNEKIDVGVELSNDDSSQSSYAPTTRTGLKPRTFTTPKGSNSTSTKSTNAIKQTSVNSATKQTPKIKTSSGLNSKISHAKVDQTSLNRLSSTPDSSQNDKTTTTRSACVVISANTIASPASRLNSSPSIKTSATKPTLITRAHPISMERSQSPATSGMKTARNFIAANKRLVSQLKEKSTTKDSNSNDASNEPDTNNEISSTSYKQVTLDDIVSRMDEFTLVSRSKLIDCLSKMLADNLHSDVVMMVKDNKQIPAHKCILAARSPYFSQTIERKSKKTNHNNNDLKNNTKEQSLIEYNDESQSVVQIDLTEYSYQSVYFSILHIYTGLVKVFQDIDMDELARLSHLLHVQSLRQVCVHELRVNYCHFFHKPCNVCSIGILKTLPIAWRYDFTELYSKCLQWIGNNFSIIFSLREMSELKPSDLIEECYSATLAQLTPDNIITKTIECQKLLKSLPRVKWTESIICLVGRLLEEFCHYVADNYEKIIQSESFTNLGKNCWECEVLEENLLAAMNHLKPDMGCKTLIQLHKLECSNEAAFEDTPNVSDSFATLVTKMRKYCERYLLKEAPAVVHCNSWRHMNPSLQKRIKDQAVLSTDFDDPTKKLGNKPKILPSSIARPGQHRPAHSPLSSQGQNLRLMR